MTGIMTAAEVRAAYAEIDRLGDETRRARWRERENDFAISRIAWRIERSKTLAIHELHDKFIKAPSA